MSLLERKNPILFIWARFSSLICFEKSVLCVDVGGGSTEFIVGKSGNVVFCCSLNLGHVSLSQREYIRGVMEESGLVESIKRCGFQAAVGSSGTIRAFREGGLLRIW